MKDNETIYFIFITIHFIVVHLRLNHLSEEIQNKKKRDDTAKGFR